MDWDDVLLDNLLCTQHVNFQLHRFCDASLQACAAVMYLWRVYVDDSVMVRLITSKTQATPVKSHTIPRLELLVALILTRLVIVVKESLLMLVDME